MAARHRAGDWTFSAKDHSTTVSPDRDTVWSFDLEGRPISWYFAGRLYKRSLGSAVHLRRRANGERLRSVATGAEAEDLFANVFGRLARLPLAQLSDDFRARVHAILAWTPQRLLGERPRFEAAYRPVSILPPDQYLAIVLQVTLGCSWNRCTFCNFYQDRPFELRSVDEFRQHLAAVQKLLGRDAARRRSIFLADGNALMLANTRLLPLIDVARQAFPARPLYGFVDVYTGERKSESDWRDLRDAGLRRVYVGLETGHDPLLAWMNKPGGADAAVDFVATLKSAGLQVSVIFMVGTGGDRFAAAHERDTLDLAARLPLHAGDLVYLSPFQEQPDSPYAHLAIESNVAPLDRVRCERQYLRLRDGMRAALPAALVTRYDIGEFVY